MNTAKYRAKMGGEIVDAEVPLNESVVTFFKAPLEGEDGPSKHQMMFSTFVQLYEPGATPAPQKLPELPATNVSTIPAVRTSGPTPGQPVQAVLEAPERLEALLEDHAKSVVAGIEKVAGELLARIEATAHDGNALVAKIVGELSSKLPPAPAAAPPASTSTPST